MRPAARAILPKLCIYLALTLSLTSAANAQVGHHPVDPTESILSEYSPQSAPIRNPPPYTLLRFNEDYRYLASGGGRDLFDRVKYIPLSSNDINSYLSFGGEIRERFELVRNRNFGVRQSGSDSYLLQRVVVHSDLHITTKMRFFLQGLSGVVWGQEGTSSAVNQNDFDLQQAFSDVVFGDYEARDPRLTLRGGRFQMTFGSGRLIATRAAPNTPIKFDGLEIIAAREKDRIYGILVKPAIERRSQVDETDETRALWGVYSTHAILSNAAIDLYYLGYRNEAADFQGETGAEQRHTIGSRLSGGVMGWNFDVEPVVQFGSFNTRQIRAWTFASDVGYTFDYLPLEPRLGLKTDVASGDRRSGGELGTFNPLFFKAGYFSDAAIIRPSNIFDIHPSLQLRPSSDVTVVLATNSLWRYSKEDAVYAPGGDVELSEEAKGGHFLGQTLEAALTVLVGKHFSFTSSYVHFFAADYVKDSLGKDVDYLGTWGTFTW